ncbi:MAG: hypothetical protein JSC085_000593 [Candidatus Tokpelaia sp. JSC085]|nr:MAG: hypothetical protein JSC085_000593 [Candidatus Tokpelaia sp. JSC085]
MSEIVRTAVIYFLVIVSLNTAVTVAITAIGMEEESLSGRFFIHSTR